MLIRPPLFFLFARALLCLLLAFLWEKVEMFSHMNANAFSGDKGGGTGAHRKWGWGRLMGEWCSGWAAVGKRGVFILAYSRQVESFFFFLPRHCRQTFWWKLVFHGSSQWENCGKFHGNNFFVAKVGKGETEKAKEAERERESKIVQWHKWNTKARFYRVN